MTKGTVKLVGGILLVLISCCLIMYIFFRAVSHSIGGSQSSAPQAPKKILTAEQRVNLGLQSTNIKWVREQLAQVPQGTLGRDKLEAHLKDLEAKAAREESEEKKQIAVLLSKMYVKHDKVEGVDWYYHSGSPRFINSKSEMWLYFEKNGPRVYNLRMKITYVADDWLFIERYVIKADNQAFEIAPGNFAIKRDNDTRIWEWYDCAVNTELLAILEAIIKSNTTILRYEGKDYRKDRTISAAEKQRLADVLQVFKALGGTI